MRHIATTDGAFIITGLIAFDQLPPEDHSYSNQCRGAEPLRNLCGKSSLSCTVRFPESFVFTHEAGGTSVKYRHRNLEK
jgi:hypothetical protein